MTDHEYVPSVDLTPWFSGTEQERHELARRVDDALRTAGFLLVTGHRVPAHLRARVRAAAGEFFALPDSVKARYAVGVGGRGWLPAGVEANGYAEGTETPADLKESYCLAAEEPTGDPATDRRWFRPNVWPVEVPALRPALTEYLDRMAALQLELMALCASALGLPSDYFASYLSHPTFGFNLTGTRRSIGSGRPRPDSSGSGRTPTSARSRSSIASRAWVACRCTPATAGGWTPRSTRTRSPSTSAT